jgi:transposase-like protein
VIEDFQMSTVLAPAQLLTHDVGVSETPSRRRFTVAYKKEILRAAERCTEPGEIAALLRREGLYSSHLATWRKAEREGHLAGAAGATRRRGPAPDAPQAQAAKAAAKAAEAAASKRIAELERELKRARARAERAEALVEAQKKVASLLDHLLPPKDDDENTGNTGKR